MSKSGEICDRICPKRRKVKQGRIAKPKEHDTSLRVDGEATKLFCKDPDSRIYLDGREKLEGEDYKARVREVLARDGGKCQWTTRQGIALAIKCNAPADDVDHIVKRSKGRNDVATNLRSLCRTHHGLRHPEHQTRFSGSKR